MERTTTITSPREGPPEERPGAVLCSDLLGCVTVESGTERAERSGRRIETLAEGVTLILGDCLAHLPMDCDAVVTDPPYGLGKRMQGGTWGAKNKEMMIWDAQPAEVSGLLELAPLVAIWGGNYYPLPPSRGWLVWHKPDAVPTMANAELAWTNQDRNTRQISWSIAATNAERVGHPTQKPVRVMAWTLEQLGVPKGATVLDPYMGSGTTGIACIRTGRRFIGIERDPKHFETALKRMRDELAQELPFCAGGGGAERQGELLSEGQFQNEEIQRLLAARRQGKTKGDDGR